MKNKKFSNRQYSLQGYVSGSLSYLPSVGRKFVGFFLTLSLYIFSFSENFCQQQQY